MTKRAILTNLSALGVLIALLGLIYWHETGSRAVPGLIEDLQSGDVQRQVLAAQWLSTLGDEARSAVPVLLEQALRHSNASVSGAAAAAVRALDLEASREIVERYRPALTDPSTDVRRHACTILGSLGLIAKPAVPSLVGMLADEDETVRERAISALGAIGLPQSEVATALTTALFDRSPLVRHRAVSLFAFTVPIPTTALEPLGKLQHDPDKTLSSLARTALDRGGGVHRTDVQLLMSSLQRLDDRNESIHRLAKLGPPAAESTQLLAKLLREQSALTRYLAAEALGSIGPAARASIPALEQATRDADPLVRAAATAALGSVVERKGPTP